MGDQASIDRQTLHELYAAALAHRVEAAPVLQAIATRASLAIGLLAPAMAELGDQALQDREQRLLAALEPHPELDPVTDAVEREVARVQLEALDLEMTRRRSTTATDLSGTPAPPTRPGLQGAVMDTIALVQEEGITAPDVESVRRIAGIVRRHILQGAGDGSLVAALLREVAMLPTPHAVDASWRFPAIALEMVVRCRDLVADTPLPVDPATLAQAVRAKRLLYGITRSDSRVDAIDWPLDLDALTVAQLLDDQAHAYTEWVRAGIPESDVGQYLAPSRREERGRPSPHEQVVPEHHARAAAEAAGGLPIPLIYPVHPQERHDVLEALWTQGLAGRHPEPGGIPPQQIGIVLYTAGGHPSVRWGATNYSFGPLAVVILPPEAILHLGHKAFAADETRFHIFTETATREVTSASDYPTHLRRLLLAAGVQAIARYDHIAGDDTQPQEVAVLDPSPNVVRLIRESIPPFAHTAAPTSSASPFRGQRRS